MSDDTSRDELIELPLGHQDSWESVDKGDEKGPPPEVPSPPRRRGRWWLAVFLLLAAAATWYLTAPRVELDPATVEFEPLRVGELSEPQGVTITNGGWRSLGVESVGVAGSASTEFRTVADDCSGAELERGASCSVEFAFAPGRPGEHSAELALAVATPRAMPDLVLLGRGVAPSLAARPERLDFGSESVGATSPGHDLELTNSGSAILHIERVTLEGSDGEFRLVGNECSRAELAPGESCSLRLVFRPALLGRREGFVEIESDAFEGSSRIALEGRGTGPDLAIDPEGLDFGSQRVGTRSEPRTLSLTNRGDESIAISSLRVADGGAFRLEREDCSGRSLDVGGTCRAVITFAPRGEGTVRSSLEIREASGGLAPGVGISGRGVSPRVRLSTRSMSFEAVRIGEESSARSLVVENSGTAILSVGRLRVGGPSAGAFAVVRDACSGTTVSPGQRCEVSLLFRPQRGGDLSARLSVPSDAPGEPPQVELSGHARAPALAIGRSRLDFAAVRQTESQDLRVEISNEGDALLRLDEISVGGAAAADFVVASNGCSSGELAPGRSCWLVVRFSPLADGPRDARLVVRSNAPEGDRSLVLQGIGRPAPEPGIGVRPQRLVFGAQPTGRRSEVLTVEVTSSGEGRLVLEEIRIDGAAADDFVVVPGTCQGLPYLVGGGECTFGVRFVPSAPGNRRARLVIEHNAAAPKVEIELAGEGL
ncbi:MAG: choice-of-anchor D domain-containing protein [Thermoanaerobaculia bacterium]|nr:choice-of-anchor D domain-containing protein [Thermoanaerobaculia bacterium]